MANVYDYYYENYLMLYSLYGRGRPTIDRERYEALDTELMALMSHVGEGLSTEQASRIGEIEYLLLDDVAEALLSKDYEERIAASDEPGADEARKKATSMASDAFPPVVLESSRRSGATVNGRQSAQSAISTPDLREEALREDRGTDSPSHGDA